MLVGVAVALLADIHTYKNIRVHALRMHLPVCLHLPVGSRVRRL